jgi:hypothetical protein
MQALLLVNIVPYYRECTRLVHEKMLFGGGFIEPRQRRAGWLAVVRSEGFVARLLLIFAPEYLKLRDPLKG